MKEDYEKYNCEENIYKPECNKILTDIEIKERIELDKKNNDSLYPNLNDKNFNIKIASKKEFNELGYNGYISNDIKEYADILSNTEFELAPHQIFTRNFLSTQTPYNSLLLYAGLGSGKTCSAIGVCEEYRDYMRQINMNKRIIIVASPNVQDNFRLQLFDERKLIYINGYWNMNTCIGNKLLKEINPTNMSGLTKENIIKQINIIINKYYTFIGYIEFSNYIEKIEESYKGKIISKDLFNKRDRSKNRYINKDISEKLRIKNLQNEFSDRLIVIDEVHNIRYTDENKNKRVAEKFTRLVNVVDNLKLLLLSATPMYNSSKEIIWLLNIMNMNDRRALIGYNSIFDKNGNLKINDNGDEIGKENLIRKATGYISYVRGENPYTFPYRIYPDEFALKNTFITNKYPIYQLNGKKIENRIEFIKVYLTEIGRYQELGYNLIINNLKKNINNFENFEGFNYTILQTPIEALNIVYPNKNLNLSNMIGGSNDKLSSEMSYDISGESEDNISSISSLKEEDKEEEKEEEEKYIDPYGLTGKKGLKNIMDYEDSNNPPVKGMFEYKKEILDNYGRIFSRNEINKYSSKIKNICDSIISPEGIVSEGIILIYSQYLDSGLIPVALALEEMGITRYGNINKSLFKVRPKEPVDYRTMDIKKNMEDFQPAKYIMITGDSRLSKNNNEDIKRATDINNMNGSKIKVILISKAGSEGIDLKYIRQIHILEPWYNMNRIEQIIGRGVRNLSHKDLPFEKRNVEIFLYGTLLENKDIEAVDLYIYRVAEYKAIQIGKVSRILKENAIDCFINIEQNNFTKEIFEKYIDIPIIQILSNGIVLDNYKIGDAPYSSICDYMEKCNYSCNNPDNKDIKINEDTYNEKIIYNNTDKIIKKIKLLMKDKTFYKKDELLNKINIPKTYPLSQIYASLTQMIEEPNINYIIDRYGRTGSLINIGEYYLFQPTELNNENISILERTRPIDYKHNSISFNIDNKKIENILNIEKQIDKINSHIQEIDYTNTLIIIETIKQNYDIALLYINNKSKVERGDDNYYKHSGYCIKHLIDKGYDKNKMYDILLTDILDRLTYENKLNLLKYIFSINIKEENSIEYKIKKYYEKMLLVYKNTIGIFLYEKDKNNDKINRKLWILKNNKFELGEYTDEKDLEKVIKEKYIINKENINNIIGYLFYDTKYIDIIFKVKDISNKRNKGAICSQAGKNNNIKILNEIIKEDIYTKENTKIFIDIDICIIQNYILRYKDIEEEIKIKKDKIKYFFNFEETNIYNLEKK